MQGCKLTWEVPFLYRIDLLINKENIASRVENLLNGKVVAATLNYFDETVFRKCLKTNSGTFKKNFKVDHSNLNLIFLGGLQGGGSSTSKMVKGSNSNAVEMSLKNERGKTRLINESHLSNPEESLNILCDGFGIEESKENIEENNIMQNKAVELASDISEQMKTGTLESSCLDQMLEISPYQCIEPFKIASIIISSFDYENLWINELLIEERAKIAKICRKFIIAEYNKSKDISFQMNKKLKKMMANLENVKLKIENNISKLPEICTLLEINTMIFIIGRASSNEGIVNKIRMSCNDIFKLLSMAHRKEIEGTCSKLIEFYKKLKNFKASSYENYIYSIDILDSATEIDPDSNNFIEVFITEQLSEFEKMQWEKQHALIGFVCEYIFKGKISIDFSKELLRTFFKVIINSTNDRIRQKAAVCIRYFSASNDNDIKEFGDRYKSLMLIDENKDGIKKILKLPLLICENSLLRSKKIKKLAMLSEIEKLLNNINAMKNGTNNEQIKAKNKFDKRVKEIKEKMLTFGVKKRNELIRDISKVKTLLYIKQSNYLKNRVNIITDEDWVEVHEIQIAKILTQIRLSLDKAKGKKAEINYTLKDISDKLDKNGNVDKDLTFDVLLKVESTYKNAHEHFKSFKNEYDQNDQLRKILSLTREMLVNEILDSPLPNIDFSGSILIAEQKEVYAYQWYDKVISELEELEFDQMLNASEEEGESFKETQNKKWNELNAEYKILKSEVDKILKSVNYIEVDLNDYFNKLNIEKPKVMQSILNAKQSLDYLQEAFDKLNKQNKKCKKHMQILIDRIRSKHPEIKLSKRILDKYSTDPLSYIKRNQERFEKYKIMKGDLVSYNIQAMIEDTAKIDSEFMKMFTYNRDNPNSKSFSGGNYPKDLSRFPDYAQIYNPYPKYAQENLYLPILQNSNK